jgi:hypothetical protein
MNTLPKAYGKIRGFAYAFDFPRFLGILGTEDNGIGHAAYY